MQEDAQDTAEGNAILQTPGTFHPRRPITRALTFIFLKTQ
jgi:hypothetical protein